LDLFYFEENSSQNKRRVKESKRITKYYPSISY